MKKNKNIKKNNKGTKTIGTFKILKETAKEYVVWDVEMDNDVRSTLIKEGMKIAKSNPDIYINIGLLDVIERGVKNGQSK